MKQLKFHLKLIIQMSKVAKGFLEVFLARDFCSRWSLLMMVVLKVQTQTIFNAISAQLDNLNWINIVFMSSNSIELKQFQTVVSALIN